MLSALYYAHGGDSTAPAICVMMCSHVDDLIWAATVEGEPKMQVVLGTCKIGRVEEGKFRFCGCEYVQHDDFSIEVNARDNTRAIKPLSLPKAEATEPVKNAQRTALRSVAGSLAWVAPDLAYRVSALQTQFARLRLKLSDKPIGSQNSQGRMAIGPSYSKVDSPPGRWVIWQSLRSVTPPLRQKLGTSPNALAFTTCTSLLPASLGMLRP